MARLSQMSGLLLYTEQDSPRLQYICDFVGRQLTGKPIRITTSLDDLIHFEGYTLNYSQDAIKGVELWIAPAGLMLEKGIRVQTISVGSWQQLPVCFVGAGELGFDLFSAIFYLISRYEEYLPHEQDAFGRYAHHQSLAWKQGWIDRPLINEWMQAFALLLQTKWKNFQPLAPTFSLLPTYDIDIAWSDKHKPVMVKLGRQFRSIIQGNWSKAAEQRSSGSGNKPDPFDSFQWLRQLHQKFQLKPYYFFLLAARRGRYDKNIDPSIPAFRELIYQHFLQHPVGIHPSWQSGDDPSLLRSEKKELELMTGAAVVSSRQHYLRFHFPGTFRQLLDAGIRYDFSMGYGEINGFRASICTPFLWYDLEKEQQTELVLVPFCFMEATSIYELKHGPEEALRQMQAYYRETRKVNGQFCMIWHNHLLGTDPAFSGWREMYQRFFEELG